MSGARTKTKDANTPYFRVKIKYKKKTRTTSPTTDTTHNKYS